MEKKFSISDLLMILACIILAWLMTACKTPQPIVQTEVKEIVREREVRDTIVTIAPDSASIKALLECDSAGNVLIKELQEAQGKNEHRLGKSTQDSRMSIDYIIFTEVVALMLSGCNIKN